MKISFVTDDLSQGGAQKMMAFVISAVSEIAEEIVVVLRDKGKIDYEVPDNVRFLYMVQPSKNSKIKRINDIRCILSYRKQLVNIVKSEKIDIVCVFGYYYATVAALAKKRSKVKVIGSERRSPMDLNMFWRNVSKISYAACDKMVFQVEGARAYYNFSQEKAVIIPNPYISAYAYSKPCNTAERKKTIILAAARLEYEKGFDIGIKAMRLIAEKKPEYKLLIYGHGDFEEMYGKLVDELDLREYVIYKGLSKRIIDDIYDASVFVLPSRSEGIPNMLLEAMGAGLPCVAADCNPGGPRMLIGNNERGVLVKMGDYEETANVVVKLLNDEKLAERYAQAAMSVKDIYAKEKIEKCWREVFLSLY